MSYTIVICRPPVPEDDQAAWRLMDELVGRRGPVPAVFHELIDRLTARYPCVCDLPDDEVDDGAWSDGPLRDAAGHAATVLGIAPPLADEVRPFVVEVARSLGLAAFDPQLRRIDRP